MNKKISLLLCVCCLGNICQADPVEEIRDLQNKLKSGVSRIQKRKLLQEMEDRAFNWHGEINGSIKSVVDNIFSRTQSQDDRKIIILNTLLLLAFPEDCLGVTKLIEEIKDIKGVRNTDIGNLLNGIKEHLRLSEDFSPIVIFSKRYPIEPAE
ncbi:MAG: hypothetical protein LBJ13_02105 [Puniceicoccales bacterium]|jgi:hypothetical protein|nr:hypothetical protein [Puniceicoccales bacterium]